jgi:hypothetical protein
MKFPNSSILSLGFAVVARAAPTLQFAEAKQPEPIYPIGKNGGSNAKVAGTVFNIDGRVEYFAGMSPPLLILQVLIGFRVKRMVACTSEQELRYRYRLS